MSTQLDVAQFNDTPVVLALKAKQPTQDADATINEPPKKSRRGRKKIYLTDEARINARRLQQKQYRDRKRNELLELRALKASLDQKQST